MIIMIKLFYFVVHDICSIFITNWRDDGLEHIENLMGLTVKLITYVVAYIDERTLIIFSLCH